MGIRLRTRLSRTAALKTRRVDVLTRFIMPPCEYYAIETIDWVVVRREGDAKLLYNFEGQNQYATRPLRGKYISWDT
jgi:hypothetical protein